MKKRKSILRLRIGATEKGTPFFLIWCGRTRLKIKNLKSLQEIVETLNNVIAQGQKKKKGNWSCHFKTRGPKNWHFLLVKNGDSLEFTIQQLSPVSAIGVPQFVNVFEWKGTPVEYLKAYVEFMEVCFHPAGPNADTNCRTFVKVREITIEHS